MRFGFEKKPIATNENTEESNKKSNHRTSALAGLAMAILPTDAEATDLPSKTHQHPETVQSEIVSTLNENISNEKRAWTKEMRDNIEHGETEVGGIAVIDKDGKFTWSYVGTFSSGTVGGHTYSNFLKTEVGGKVKSENIEGVIQFHTHPQIYHFAPPSEPDIAQGVFDAPAGAKVTYMVFEPKGVWYWDRVSLSKKAEASEYYRKDELAPEAQEAYLSLFGSGDVFTEPTSRNEGKIAVLLETSKDDNVKDIYRATQQDDISHFLRDTDNVFLMRDLLFRYALLAYPSARFASEGSLFQILSSELDTAEDFKVYESAIQALENDKYASLRSELDRWRKQITVPTEQDFQTLYSAYATNGIKVHFETYK